MNKLNVIDGFAARLLMVSFFLPERWQVFSVMGAGVYFVLRSFFTKQSIPNSNYVWAFILGCSYLLYVFSFFVTAPGYKNVVLFICYGKASCFLLPIVFAIITPAFGELIKKELLYFVAACFLTCLAANLDYGYHYFFFKGGLHEFSHVEYRVIMERFTGIQPTYLGMFLCFSICITLLYSGFNYGYGRILKYALVYALLVFLLALLVKSSLIALMIIFVLYGYAHRESLYRDRALLTGMFAGVAATCFFIPFIGQRAMEILSYFGIGKRSSIADNSVYIRKLIFDTDTGLLKGCWVTGVGPGRVLHLLKEHYFFYSLAHNSNVGSYDPHNEYFSEWLSFGIAGIVLLLTVLMIHFRKALMAKNELYLYILIILFMTFFTETVLSRQEGVLFYAIFTSLFFFSSNHITNSK